MKFILCIFNSFPLNVYLFLFLGNILLNTIVHDRHGHPLQHRLRRQPEQNHHHAFGNHDTSDLSDNNTVLGELLAHVRQLNEEIHQRHIGNDADEHYKSEWRMVALILDRILLILFFIMTVFTCVVIFVNVPDWKKRINTCPRGWSYPRLSVNANRLPRRTKIVYLFSCNKRQMETLWYGNETLFCVLN